MYNDGSSPSTDDEYRSRRRRFRKRMSSSKSDNKKKQKQDDQAIQFVDIAVKAGLLCIGGISLCFSSFLIPGIIPFLGGLLCGVSLVDPPPLPKVITRSVDEDDDGDLVKRDTHNIIMQVLMNFIHHMF
jgi:hypothetical protein